jgi:hypothetical protein
MVWFFDRNGQKLRYEIRHAAVDREYELEVTFPDGRIETEAIRDAADLLRRCAERARALKDDGWQAA